MKKKITNEELRKAIRKFEGIKIEIEYPFIPDFILNNKEVETPKFLLKNK